MEVEEIKITTKLRSIIEKAKGVGLTVDDFRLRKSKTIPYRKPSAEALLQYGMTLKAWCIKRKTLMAEYKKEVKLPENCAWLAAHALECDDGRETKLNVEDDQSEEEEDGMDETFYKNMCDIFKVNLRNHYDEMYGMLCPDQKHQLPELREYLQRQAERCIRKIEKLGVLNIMRYSEF